MPKVTSERFVPGQDQGGDVAQRPLSSLRGFVGPSSPRHWHARIMNIPMKMSQKSRTNPMMIIAAPIQRPMWTTTTVACALGRSLASRTRRTRTPSMGRAAAMYAHVSHLSGPRCSGPSHGPRPSRSAQRSREAPTARTTGPRPHRAITTSATSRKKVQRNRMGMPANRPMTKGFRFVKP